MEIHEKRYGRGIFSNRFLKVVIVSYGCMDFAWNLQFGSHILEQQMNLDPRRNRGTNLSAPGSGEDSRCLRRLERWGNAELYNPSGGWQCGDTRTARVPGKGEVKIEKENCFIIT